MAERIGWLWKGYSFAHNSIAYHKKQKCEKSLVLDEWVHVYMVKWMYGWVGGFKSHFKDCLQQSKIKYVLK